MERIEGTTGMDEVENSMILKKRYERISNMDGLYILINGYPIA